MKDLPSIYISYLLLVQQTLATGQLALSLRGLNAVAEDHDGLGIGVALHDGHGRCPRCQIFADEAISRDGVDIGEGKAWACHFGDGERSNWNNDQGCTGTDGNGPGFASEGEGEVTCYAWAIGFLTDLETAGGSGCS